MKKCNQCKEILSLDSFYKCKGYKEGVRTVCKTCHKLNTNKYCKDNRKQYRNYHRKSRAANPGKRRTAERKWWANRTLEQVIKSAEQHDSYRKKNMDKFRMYANNRKAAELQATPKWVNKAYMGLWYKAALIEEERTGKRVNVDHIIPLQNSIVCGLHCEDNMQLLFAIDNLKKHNKFEIEGHC